MYYYYRIDGRGNPIPGSNSSSKVRINSPYYVYFTVDTMEPINFSPSGSKYFVKLNTSYKPIPSTLMKGQRPYTKGWIEISPTCCSDVVPSLPIPVAPTEGDGEDDVNNIYNFTVTPGYTATQHEYLKQGDVWTTATSEDIAFGNINFTGTLSIRVKAIPGVSQAGQIFTTSVAFTEDVALPDPDAEAYFLSADVSDVTEKSSTTQLVKDFKALGVYPNLRFGQLYFGNNPTVDLANPAFTPTSFGTPVIGTNGIEFDGVDDYLDTEVVSSTDFPINELTEISYIYNTDSTGALRGAFDTTVAGYPLDATFLGGPSSGATAAYIQDGNITVKLLDAQTLGVTSFSASNMDGPASRTIVMDGNGDLRSYQVTDPKTIDKRPTKTEFLGAYNNNGSGATGFIDATVGAYLLFNKGMDATKLRQAQQAVHRHIVRISRTHAGDTTFKTTNSFNDGLYNAFPRGWDMPANQLMFIYKKSVNHPVSGETIFCTSNDGGATIKEKVLMIDGKEAVLGNYSLGQAPTGSRKFLFYVNDYLAVPTVDHPLLYPTAQSFNVAICDDDSGNFTTVYNVSKDAGADIIVANSGRAWVDKDGYLQKSFVEVTGGVATIGFIRSTDLGMTWPRLVNTMLTTTGVGYSDADRPNTPVTEEFTVTALDAAKLQLITIIRTSPDTGAALPKFGRSSDGGLTWDFDLSRYWFMPFTETWAPVDITVVGSEVWVIGSNRHSTGKRQVAKASIADAFNNTGWVVIDLATYAGYGLAGHQDFGYDYWVRSGNELNSMSYDTSVAVSPITGAPACFPQIVQIV